MRRLDGPFQGPSSYHLFYRWSLIQKDVIRKILDLPPTDNGCPISERALREDHPALKGVGMFHQQSERLGIVGWLDGARRVEGGRQVLAAWTARRVRAPTTTALRMVCSLASDRATPREH